MSPTFWAALKAGLGAPVMLFAPAQSYNPYVAVASPQESLAAAGSYLSAALASHEAVAQSRTGGRQ